MRARIKDTEYEDLLFGPKQSAAEKKKWDVFYDTYYKNLSNLETGLTHAYHAGLI